MSGCEDMLEVSVRENILQRLRGQPAEGSEVHSFGASKLKIEHGGWETHFGSGRRVMSDVRNRLRSLLHTKE